MPAPLNLFGLRQELIDSLVPFSYDLDEDRRVVEEEEEDDDDDEEEDKFDQAIEELQINVHLKGSPYVFYSSPHLDESHVLAIYKRWFDLERLQTAPVDALRDLNPNGKSCVLLIGGGHFAGAIIEHKPKSLVPDKFNPFANIVITHHKSFHRYTTRRKQGGAQSASDNANGKANSAGSSIRRQNEMMLRQEVQQLIESWGPEIKQCDRIFYHASGRTNRGIIVGFAPKCPIQTSDPRLRTIPLTTKRPTADEIKRVWKELTTARIVPAPELQPVKVTTPKPAATSEPKHSSTPKQKVEVSAEEKRDNEIVQAIKKSNLVALRPLVIHDLNGTIAQIKATPLIYAARTGKHQVVSSLLRWGADPTIKVGGRTLGEAASAHPKVVDTLSMSRKALGEKWNWTKSGVGAAMSADDIKERDEAARRAKAESQRQAFEQEEKKQKEQQIEKLINKHGSGHTMGGTTAQTAGLSEEEKRHIERERRARAAEARMARQ